MFALTISDLNVRVPKNSLRSNKLLLIAKLATFKQAYNPTSERILGNCQSPESDHNFGAPTRLSVRGQYKRIKIYGPKIVVT